MRVLSPARLLAAAVLLAAALAGAPPASAATAPQADYQLQGRLTSTVAGVPALTPVAAGNSFRKVTVDRVADRTVLQYPKGSGLALSGARRALGASTYTVVLLYRPSVVDGAFHRVLDMHGGDGDPGLYERAGQLYAYPDAVSSGSPITASAFSQIVLTRTGGGAVSAWVDGKKVLSFTDTSARWLATDLVRFGKDNTTTGAVGEETGGQFARIRLYDVALPPASVPGLDRLPNGSSDVSVTYTASPDPVQRHGLLAYTATVKDNGPSAAAGVTVTLTLPAGSTFVGASTGQGSCAAPASGRVVCTLGALPVGAQTQALLVVRAPSGAGTVSSTATVSSSSTDASPGNDTATQTTAVR